MSHVPDPGPPPMIGLTPDESKNAIWRRWMAQLREYLKSEEVPSFRARMLTPNQALPDVTYTKLRFDSEEFDTISCYDAATNYRYTPNVAGTYLIHASVTFSATVSNSALLIYKNGVEYTRQRYAPATNDTMTVSALVPLNGTTDYVEAYFYHSTGGAGGASYAATDTFFEGHRIGQ